MSFPRDAYPYTNFHELNLGYFITHFREIFSQWADLYDQMLNWKEATDEELATWKAGVEADLDQRETVLRAELETWKAQTGQDIAGWEDATLAALTAWQTATQAVFEAIRVEAAGSASAAAASAGDAATAKTAAETAQAAAEAAAASVQASAAQITTNTEDIADLKTQLNFQRDDNFWSYGTITKGYAIAPMSSGNDLIVNADYNTTDFIPVNPGDIIYGKGSRFKTYDADKVKQYSAIFSNLTTELQNGYKYYIIPDGISYFRICDEVASGKFLIAKVNPYEYWMKNFIDNYISSVSQNINKIPTIETRLENTKNQLNLQYNDNFWSYGEITKGYAVANRLIEPDLAVNAEFDTSDYIPVIPGDIIYGKGARFKTYDSEKTAIYTGIFSNLSTELQNGWKYYVIPEGVAYFRICANNTTGTFMIAKVNPYEYWINNKIDNFDLGDIEERIEALENPPKTKTLYAIGDSITRGMYAEFGDTSAHGPTTLNYVYWLGEIKRFNVVNLGESGGGYAQKGTQTNSNGKDIVDNNQFENADIVTIALGINDYKHDPQSSVIISLGDMTSQSGDGSVIGNMKYMIENIYNKAPTANIIIMLPMNQNRFGYNNMSFADNWSMGYAFRENKTLTDYRNAIKECADYYNLTVIDEEFITPINRYNIRYCLGDGLHPTRAFYKRMAQAFAPFVE